MGSGFRLSSLKWDLPIRSPLVNNSSSNSPSRLSSSPARSMEASINHAKLSFLSVLSEEGDFTDKDTSKVHPYARVFQTSEDGFSEIEGLKMKVGKRPQSRLNNMIEEAKASTEVPKSPSRFGLLLENLDILEESVADSDVLKLKNDILLHLDRLGALELFNTCLSRTLEKQILALPDVPIDSVKECKTNVTFDDHEERFSIGSGETILDLSDVPAECSKERKRYVTPDDHAEKIIVRTGKKEHRKSRRERASRVGSKATSLSLPSKTVINGPQRPGLSSAKRVSNPKSRRLKIATNEAEMSKGVKLVSKLERIWTILEKETGQVPSLSSWAEAARLDKKVLQWHLHFGLYCRDELIRSTRSLVLFLARSYRGFGVALEDLLQAGCIGVLQGAERFDHTKGYRFSTYVQYWIRKSMSKTVAHHARGIKISCNLSHTINQIHRARKILSSIHGKHPDDKDIADFTGLTVAKVESASKCLRVVGSVDKKFGDGFNAKYLEFTPDTAMQSPEEAVMRHHMRRDIYDILRGLESRERQVLVLRYGLEGYQPKSLEEIGRLFHVSKEWVRRLEKKVLMKISDEETQNNLSHYANL